MDEPGNDIRDLIEQSSLGTPGARQLRRRTSPEHVAAVRELSKQGSQHATAGPPPTPPETPSPQRRELGVLRDHWNATATQLDELLELTNDTTSPVDEKVDQLLTITRGYISPSLPALHEMPELQDLLILHAKLETLFKGTLRSIYEELYKTGTSSADNATFLMLLKMQAELLVEVIERDPSDVPAADSETSRADWSDTA